MTQKQLITANNAELEKHKQDILNLPMADDVKNGKWVWKKYDGPGKYTVTATDITTNSARPAFKMTSDKIDVTKLSSSDLVAEYKSENYGSISLRGDGTCKLHSGTGIDCDGTWTYDAKNATVNVVTSGSWSVWPYPFSAGFGKDRSFLGYTVSDSETAYPDGGEQDGFWWERVKEGWIESTYIEMGRFTITPTTDTNRLTYPKPLASAPDIVIVKARTKKDVNGQYAMFASKRYMLNKHYRDTGMAAGFNWVTSEYIDVTDTYFNLNAQGNFVTGVTYEIIALKERWK